MSSPDVHQDLRLAEAAGNNAVAAHRDYMAACRLFDWAEAEICRTAALAFLEAQLDAFARACRRLELS